MRRIGKITGRSDDMMIIRGVNVFPTQIEELICKMPKLAPQYQLIVSRDGHLDKLDVVGEIRPELTGKLTDNEIEALAHELEHHIKTYVGVTTKVRLLASGSIERTQTGKAKRVIDKRPKMV
jgi:phenylacetate-CoA ligase